MTRFVIRRVALSLVTLFILLVIIFLLTSVVADDPARQLAGPFASQETIDDIAERIGQNDPKWVQFKDLIVDTVTFDFGDSFQFNTPVRPRLFEALGRSALLVAFALCLTIPISIAGGIVAARRRDSLADRSIVTVGLASSSIPEFVSGVILQYLIGVRLGWFPALATTPDDAALVTKLDHLVLPALAILLVYFGYIARITRAGTITAMEADYTRTARMKGLTERKVIGRHVLRNALQPTVAVVGTQVGYLFGGLVGLEIIFNYNGLGTLIFTAANRQDFAMLQGGVILVAIIFMVTTLLADLIIAWMNPRARLGLRDQ